MKIGNSLVAALVLTFVLDVDVVRAQSSSIRVGRTATLTLGGSPKTTNEELLDVVAATKLSNGNIALGDRGSYQVRVYDRRGTLLGAHGRRGRGPGDFMSLTRLWRGPKDTVYAYDFSEKRVSVFSPTGRFVRTWPAIETLSRTFIDGVFSDGSLLAELDIQPPEATQTGIERRFKRLARVRPDGKVVDTIPELFLRGETFVFVGASGPIGTARAPLSRFGHTVVHNDAIYFGDGEEFTIKKLDRAGRTQQTFSRRDEPVSLSKQERTEIIDQITHSPRMPSAFGAMLREQLEKFFAEGKFARYDTVMVDGAGRVWARESLGYTAPMRTWTVFGTDGSVLGRVPISAEMTVLEIGTDYILTSGTSGDGFTVVNEFSVVVSPPSRRE